MRELVDEHLSRPPAVRLDQLRGGAITVTDRAHMQDEVPEDSGLGPRAIAQPEIVLDPNP
jgi:hypothetical protein